MRNDFWCLCLVAICHYPCWRIVHSYVKFVNALSYTVCFLVWFVLCKFIYEPNAYYVHLLSQWQPLNFLRGYIFKYKLSMKNRSSSSSSIWHTILAWNTSLPPLGFWKTRISWLFINRDISHQQYSSFSRHLQMVIPNHNPLDKVISSKWKKAVCQPISTKHAHHPLGFITPHSLATR